MKNIHRVESFFDDNTATLTYVVYDNQTKDAVIIDPVLDYDAATSTFSKESIDKVVGFVTKNKLTVHFILETHAHADHLSGSQFLKETFEEANLLIGAKITDVQSAFKHIFNVKDFNENGIQFDKLLNDNEVVCAGSLEIKTLYTPGHTPACVSYVINNTSVFTGDVLFMHDYGTGRCDFPGGSAEEMYESITQRLYTLSDDTKVYVGHDYCPGGRSVQYESTIGVEKKQNPHLNKNTTKEDFVEKRKKRDKTLKSPKLLLQSLQVNIDAGNLPSPENNGTRYLKIPLRKKG
jgi:glyoxylase-like metal-dependent hydrolase (beta-lactamase superfamily II)